MSRRVTLERPFTQGLASDKEPYLLGQQESYDAQDVIAPEGIARQRRGWGWHSGSILGALGVWRASYVLADATRTTGYNSAGEVFTGTTTRTDLSGLSGEPMIPRAQYRDQTILCSLSGWANQFYGGAVIDDQVTTTTGTWVANSAQFNSGTALNQTSAAYLNLYPSSATTGTVNKLNAVRVLTATGSLSTIENVRNTASTANPGQTYSANIAKATVPCINIYDAGLVTITGTTATGAGTDWETFSTDAGVSVSDMGMLIIPETSGTVGTTAALCPIRSFSSETTALVAAPTVTNRRYALLAPCAFKDVAVRDNSLYGTGMAQYPSRVYIGPPDWDLFFPPGAARPFDASVFYQPENVNHFLLDFVDVPSSYDGDDNVALLETSNSVLVLKRGAVYGIFGSFPQFQVEMVSKGAGCLDLRSAWNLAAGPVWAGHDGIYAFTGSPTDLTEGKINREWRSLTDGFVEGTDVCTIGQVYDHILVSITTDGGTTQRTYCYDITQRAWISKFNNHHASFYFSARVPGEDEELLWVDSAGSGRVKRSREVFDGSGSATDQAWTGTEYPRMVARTSQNLSGAYTQHTRIYDATVHANVYDTGSTAYLSVDVTSGGGRDANATSTKTVGTIPSDGVDRIDRKHFRAINKAGRLHDITITTGSTGTTTGAIEIATIETTFTPGRTRG